MELKLIKAVWGMDETWPERFRKIAEAGYQGLETPMPAPEDEAVFRELQEQYKLDLVIQVYSGLEEHRHSLSGKVHYLSLEEQVERARTFQPILINSQSAKDAMPYEEQLYYFEKAIALEKKIGIPISHETHRGRATFTPWTTARLLKDLPDLRIAADFSHWCNVCESILPDQEQNLRLAIERSIHIHGRVGFEHGPQVPDYRAPEYAYALAAHERWWDAIIAEHLKRGEKYLTFTPEFGPPGYMHTQPYTQMPVVDLWEICFAMGQHFKARFNAFLESSAARESVIDPHGTVRK
mgnify:CR=1 FL=1